MVLFYKLYEAILTLVYCLCTIWRKSLEISWYIFQVIDSTLFWGSNYSRQYFMCTINYLLLIGIIGPIHLLNTRKYCGNTCKYWDNTYKYWANTWKMCSPASVIFESIFTLLVSFEAILMYFKACGRSLLWNWLIKLILTQYFRASEYTVWNKKVFLPFTEHQIFICL